MVNAVLGMLVPPPIFEFAYAQNGECKLQTSLGLTMKGEAKSMRPRLLLLCTMYDLALSAT